MRGSGALWQAGLSAEYTAGFAFGFAQTWVGGYMGGAHIEADAGAGLGLPLSLVNGHACPTGLCRVRVLERPSPGIGFCPALPRESEYRTDYL
jgi:hypothetical protein